MIDWTKAPAEVQEAAERIKQAYEDDAKATLEFAKGVIPMLETGHEDWIVAAMIVNGLTSNDISISVAQVHASAIVELAKRMEKTIV